MIFDDWKSIIHFLLGFVACFVFRFCWAVSALFASVFLIYECFESKTVGELLCDVFEFVVGVVLCCFVSYFCLSKLNIACLFGSWIHVKCHHFSRLPDWVTGN